MSARFIQLYLFFKKHRVFFYLFSGALLAVIFFFASKISLKEDISGMTGSGNEAGTIDYVISHSKLSDKLIIRLSTTGEAESLDPGILTTTAKDLTDSLLLRFDTTYIHSLIGNINDTSFSFYLDLLYNHLPVYLEEDNYRTIDSMLTPVAIRASIEKDYRNLLTPAGFALKKTMLRDPLGITYLAMGKLKSLQAGDNYEVKDGFIHTKDGKNLLIFITPANPSSETSRNGKLLDGIANLLSKVGTSTHGRVNGEYFGAVAVAVANARQVKKDITLTVSIALFLILLLLGWYFRSWKIPLLGFLPAVFGGGLSLALLYFIKGTVSVIALGIGSVILGLIVDYALYFINHFRKKGDMVATLREMTMTIFLCSLTSEGAFLCLIFLHSTVLHDLGLFAIFSVAGAAIFALVFLPHFLTAKDRKPFPEKANLVNRIASFRYEKNLVIIFLLMILAAVSIFFISRVRFEDDMMALNFIPENLRNMEKDLSRLTDASLKSVYIVSTGKNLDEALKEQEKITPHLNSLAKRGVVHTVSGCGQLLLSDSLQQARIRRWEEFWTPERRNALEKNLRATEKEFKFRGHALDPFINYLSTKVEKLSPEDFSTLKTSLFSDFISETHDQSMVTSVAKVSQENKKELYSAFDNKPGIIIFDRQVLANRFVAGVRQDFDLLIRLSMIFVTLLLLLSFGRIETGLTTALPMFFSWLLTLGFMGLTGIHFNIFNIIVSSFIFGLGVDYSILMMRGLLFEYKYGTVEISSYKTSIFLSSATTLFGVAALFFALHPALNSIALISVFGIITVVLVSYTFQPMLLRWFLFNRLKKRRMPVTMRVVFKTFITWGNIVLVAVLQVILGGMIFILLPVSKKKKQDLFHSLFSVLCRAYIFVTFPTNRKFYNPYREEFSKPAVIISNHQSLIETPAFLRLHPKIIMLTNQWVWDSLLFGPVARMASYFNADDGIDSIIDKLQEKVNEGFSIIIFPEGHRSTDDRIHRFHKGAFYLAEKLKIDILPVVVFGSGEFLGRGEFWGHPTGLRMKILKRVGPDDTSFGADYSERSKLFRQFYSHEYAKFMEEEATGRYFRKKLILNYIFKGPVLEWYLRIKLGIEKYYQQYNELVPRNGDILDLGCGYGFLSYMLSFTSPRRKITGVDFDEEKIRVAANAIFRNEDLEFICEDITRYEFGKKDAIIMTDVLHYLPLPLQEELLDRCIGKLNPGGKILIRDADAESENRHQKTKITEFLSTRFAGFNKTADDTKKLYFTSLVSISRIAADHGLVTEVVREARHTSNFLVILHK